MNNSYEHQSNEQRNFLLFRQTASDCLSQKIEKLLGKGEYLVPTINLIPDLFKDYGKIESDVFVPFWQDNETFDQFTQREAGLDQQATNIVMQAIQKIFIESKIPISEQDKKRLSTLASLFTPDEIDQLQGYAISVESEIFYELALTLESAGAIKPGSVQRIISPLLKLREDADLEIIDFNNQVRESANALYGSPDFYPSPEMSQELVKKIKEIEVLPQEPSMVYITKPPITVYGSTIIGEATNHASQNPIRGLSGKNSLVTVGGKENEQLTSSLLEKHSFLRYLLGAKIIENQRKRIGDLKYMFKIVREREMREKIDGEKWPFAMPAKKPATF